MKKHLFLLACLPALGTFAQDGKQQFSTKNEKKAVITAYMENSPNDTLVQLYEPYSGEYDSTRIKNHRFTLNMPMPKGGSIYVLKIGTDPDPMADITLVYVEDGKMHITGKGKKINDAKFTGDKWVKEWQEVWKLASGVKGISKQVNDLEAQLMKANEIGDEDAANSFARQRDSITAIRKEAMLDWVRKNPNSGVAGYILTCFVPNLAEKDSLIATLGQHAKESRIVQRHLNPGIVDPSPVSIKANTAEEANAKFAAVAPGKDAPDFSVPDVNGKILTLKDFKGQYLLLDFWASWCGPCKPQIPFLKAANDKFKNKNLVMLGVSLDSKKEAWLKAIESHDLNWINASSLKGWAEPIAQAYGASAIPFNVLIGPDGKILAMGLYGEDIDKKLSEIIK